MALATGSGTAEFTEIPAARAVPLTIHALRLEYARLIFLVRRDRQDVETHMDPAASATDHSFPFGV
jgi:hypothetical protein